MILSVIKRNIHEREDKFMLFGHDNATQALHKFMSIAPETATTEERDKFV